MLRFLVLLLLAANLLFFGFTRGWFDGMFGLSSIGDREPERVASQVRPNTVVLISMGAASAASAAARSGCLEAGPIVAADAATAETALRTVLAPGAWIDNRTESVIGGASVVVTHTYRVGNIDAAIAARLAALKLDASGHTFSACAKTADPTR
jgi:hypothetical protein